uniref:Uncharacterized protein n=1 Tax=Rhizophora mucronata TaxID=61149 RepID=A0A2P2QCA3_RHIMU
MTRKYSYSQHQLDLRSELCHCCIVVV